jgi:hypothetical protein
MDAATGYERCEAGYDRRLRAGTCPSTLPRARAVTNFDANVDQCEFDTNCSGLALGHCAPREGGQARVCVEGCLTDQDCAQGRICACEDPVGRCVPASCASSADCSPGFECASYKTGPGCFTTGFACQTPQDGCAADSDAACSAQFINPTFCVFAEGARHCSTLQCVER